MVHGAVQRNAAGDPAAWRRWMPESQSKAKNRGSG